MIQVKLRIPIAELGRRRRPGDESRSVAQAASVECTVGVRVRCVEISPATQTHQARVSDLHSQPLSVRSKHSVGTIRLEGPFKTHGASEALLRRHFGASAIHRTVRGLFWAILFEGAAAACLYLVWHVWHVSR